MQHPRILIMIPLSPKTQFGLDLITRLRSLPELEPYVMDRFFSDSDQLSVIDSLCSQYGGCLAVSPQQLISPTQDASVREAALACDYALVGFVSRNAWDGSGMTGVTCASDMIDSLFGLAIPMIASWDPEGVPYHAPVIVAEEDVMIDDPTLFPNTLFRALRVRVGLYYPTIQQ